MSILKEPNIIRVGRRSKGIRRMAPLPPTETPEPYDWFAVVVTSSKIDIAERTARKAGLATFVPRQRKFRYANKVNQKRRKREEVIVQRFPGLLFIGMTQPYPWHLVDEIWFARGILGYDGTPERLPLRGSPARGSIPAQKGILDIWEENRRDFAPAEGLMPTGREFAVGDTVEAVTGIFEDLRMKVIQIEGQYARVKSPFFGATRDVQMHVSTLGKVVK